MSSLSLLSARCHYHSATARLHMQLAVEFTATNYLVRQSDVLWLHLYVVELAAAAAIVVMHDNSHVTR